MFQNIKVDIIYYNTATDFEMEFNLSGCCRMRLLTDKSPDRKTLVNHLVRAVSRSRVIMITGALFGEEGLIKTCSQAINRSLEKLDTKKYSISGEEEIEILKDSIPLVSSDGIFGGCIIEQGPQTLILLSENKDIRKNIMQNLIHPYIKEVCALELTDGKTANEPAVEAEVNELIDDIVIEEIDVADEIEEETEVTEEEEPQEQEVSEEITEPSETDEEELPKEFDYSFINELISNKNEEVFPDEIEEESEFVELEEIEEPEKKVKNSKSNKNKGKKLNISILVLSVLLLLVVAVLCYALFISPESREVSTGQYIKETFDILFG